MPIYEYACRECDHVLEALQKMSDDPLVHCPSCGEAALRKLLSAPRFRLKGSGWYETDFKDGNRRNVLKPDSDSTGSKPDGAAKDAKPAKATEATTAKTAKKADES